MSFPEVKNIQGTLEQVNNDIYSFQHAEIEVPMGIPGGIFTRERNIKL